MNIIEARQLVLKYLETNESIQIDEDFSKLVPVSIEEERDKAAITLALKTLEAASIVGSFEKGKKTYWILGQPLVSLPQTITLSYSTAKLISTIINQYCQAQGDEVNICDVGTIREKDIQNLGIICDNLMKAISQAQATAEEDDSKKD